MLMCVCYSTNVHQMRTYSQNENAQHGVYEAGSVSICVWYAGVHDCMFVHVDESMYDQLLIDLFRAGQLSKYPFNLFDS